jgi:methylase of polypeptide subunit release factors
LAASRAGATRTEAGGGNPLPAARNRALGQLRETLAHAGYDERGLHRAVREGGLVGLAEGLAALPLRPDADEPLSVLARLLLGGEAIEVGLAAAALAPLAPSELGELLTVRDGVVRAHVRLQPFEGLLIASDRRKRLGANHVLGIGGGTRILAGLTVRRPVETALDLCTGSGSLALLAARHAERVVGVDLNRRALRLARVNAALNGITGIEWRQGDLFEPVGDEQFDLVIANPPYIVSPRREFLYRDGGREDDALSRSVVTGAAARLREGGYAHIFCNWVAPAHGRWSKAPRSWLRGAGCDAWLLHNRTESPAAYALRWNLRPGRTLATAAAAAGAWVDYYRTRGINAIATGAIVLRRRNGRNWLRDDEFVRTPIGAAGAHVERVFAAQDLLRSLKDERELLAMPLAAAPQTMLVERREPSGALERARLTVEEGIPLAGRIPPACHPVVAALNGRRPLRTAIEAAARRSGVPTEALTTECLPTLTELLARGLLVAQAPG